MNIRALLTEDLIDIALGLYVYTYPKLGGEELKVHIPRPWGFRVYEVINGINLENIVIDDIAKSDIRVCDEVYTYIAEKINIDSYTLCNILKKILQCSSCELLGLKDTKAVVRQVVVLRNCSNVVKSIDGIYRDGYIKAAFWQCNSSIIHNSNKFSVDIVIESGGTDIIRERLKVMKKHNFIFLNFFGYQRFGTLKPITHMLGKLLIRREWNLFLDTLCKLGIKLRSRTPENIVCSLAPRYGTALKVIKRIPKTYLIFYVNAYQSYIFNVVLSKLWLKLIEDQGFEKAFELLRSKYRYVPIVGSKMYIGQSDIKEIIDKVLEIEKIQLEDFNIKPLGIEVKGGIRKTLEHAYDVEAQFKDGKVTLSFALNRGCYATVFIRELLRTDPTMYV